MEIVHLAEEQVRQGQRAEGFFLEQKKFSPLCLLFPAKDASLAVCTHEDCALISTKLCSLCRLEKHRSDQLMENLLKMSLLLF